MAASRRDILRLLDELDGPIADAFWADVLGIATRAQVKALTAAIVSGDLDAVMIAAGYRPGSWSTMTEATRAAYIKAGIATIAADVPKRFGMTFDLTNPRAEAWLREHSSQLVTLINNEQREAIRVVLEAGMQAGRNPRSIALDIVGRMSKQAKRRTGGIVGLNGPQTGYVLNAREELENLDSNYFTRKRRDRRFDSIVRKAIDADKPMSASDINRITGRYSDRLLELRGTTIGRTEALSSMNEASDEALRQVVQQGLAPPEAVLRIWDAAGDSKTRASHVAMDMQERGLDETFTAGSGASLMHPGDSSHGAGAGEIINCRCIVTHKIDFIAVELAA